MEPETPCPECAGRRVVPSALVMAFVRKHGVAAFQVGHAILALETDRWGRSGYDPALYSEAGFDEAATEDFQRVADCFQIHSCPVCAPHENAEGPSGQAAEAMAAYSAKIAETAPTGGHMRRDPSSGTIRIIVHVAGVKGNAFADLPTTQLQRWLSDLDDLTDRPLGRWTIEGGQRAVRIFNVSASAGEHLVACLAALWILLYVPRPDGSPGLSLDDLQTGADCTLTIRVSSDRCRWDYALTCRHGSQGGIRTVPGIDFETVGNA
jgi:hypothetical protein